MRSRPVAVVILAAGGSRRMGRPKQLLPFRGRALLRRAADAAIASACRPIVVTTGAHEPLLTRELQSLPLVVAHNPNWADGIGSSLRVAIETLARLAVVVDGVVITLADQPLVSARDINRLVEVHDRSGKDIVASQYADTFGVPMFVGTRLFAELVALNGDAGAKRLIARRPDDVATMPLPAAAVDIDTPLDYERLAGLRAIQSSALVPTPTPKP
jgi:molybdenum cofactor cytidylyltransferase